MKNVWEGVRLAFGVVGGIIGGFLQPVRGPVIALVVFVVLDYLTGILAAVVKKELSSETGWHGLIRKVAIFVLVGLSALLDTYALDGATICRTATVFFYLANEGISILENCSRIGIPIPKKLEAILIQIQEEKDNEQ